MKTLMESFRWVSFLSVNLYAIKSLQNQKLRLTLIRNCVGFHVIPFKFFTIIVEGKKLHGHYQLQCPWIISHFQHHNEHLFLRIKIILICRLVYDLIRISEKLPTFLAR